MTNPRRKKIYYAIAIALLVLILFSLFKSPPSDWQSAEALGEFVQSKGMLGVVLLLIATMCATAVGLPRQFFAFVAGFSFGLPLGLLIASVGALAGAAITFVFAKRFLQRWVHSKFPEQLAMLNRFVRDDAVLKIIVLRLQPLGTNFISNCCAGVSSISPAKFFIASAVGYIPQMLVFALMGSGVRIGSNTYISVSVILFTVSLLIGWLLYRRAVASQFG